MSLDLEKIFNSLANKNVLIWGARMTGIGALRQLKKKNITVLNFIDSDNALVGKFVHGLKVYHPNQLSELVKNHEDLVILIAVSIKENEILNQISKLNIMTVPIVSFFDDKAPHYHVDILGACNLKCPSCPQSSLEKNIPKGSMTIETFKSVFDKIINDTPSISNISLYNWGEPFLHPYLDKIIDYIHAKNVAVSLSSNLSIKFNDRIEKIIKANPDYLKVSLSGFYPKAYNSTHTGGDINLVKNNLVLIRKLIDEYKTDTLIDINYHLYKDNSGENLKQMENFANNLGFIISKTYALIMPVERVISYLEGNEDFEIKKLKNNLLVTVEEGIEASSKFPLPKNTCPYRENQIIINSDLTVPVCCTVWERKESIVAQNFLKNNINEINLNKKKIAMCQKCMDLRLPESNMGLNQNGWAAYAKEKKISD